MLDTDIQSQSLLPAHFHVCQLQLLEGTGFEDYGYFFDYDDDLDLSPPANSERPDCVGGQ